MRRRYQMFVQRVLGVLLFTAVSVWAADPVLGTWKLNVAKSKYNPGPAPKSQTRLYEKSSQGVTVTVATIEADGQSSSIALPANEDGKDYPIMASGPADAIALTKIDSQTDEAILKHGAAVVGTSRRVISQDGKTMTITYKGTNRKGEQVDNVGVYEKQ
jgi:hypothetical protein